VLFHPFVPVQTQFDRIRDIRADLDKRGSPFTILQVEVVVIDRDRLPGEIEGHAPARTGAFVGLERARLFLRDANHHDPVRPREFRPIRGDDRVLARLEFNEWHRVLGRIRFDCVHKVVVHRAEQRRRGNRMPEMIAQEVAEAARGLQLGHIALQVDPIEAPHRQRHVIPDNALDVGHHTTLLGRKVDDGTPREYAGHDIGPNIKRPRSGRAVKVRRSRGRATLLRVVRPLQGSTAPY
jgi:hypothetical protein